MNGLHLIGDLSGCRCDPQLLLDGKRFEQVCVGMVEAAGLAVMDASTTAPVKPEPSNWWKVDSMTVRPEALTMATHTSSKRLPSSSSC